MMRALILFGFLGLFASSAWGECIPVVFAFRHAEDAAYNRLTPTGMAHAELYKSMVSDFESTVLESDKKPCLITKVYAATNANKPNGDQSATNSFNTATPLAQARMGATPITTVTTVEKEIRQLYEFVSNNTDEPTDPNYDNATATALRAELRATANRQESSAIFWTSQGLHVLGGAIINATSNIPKKPAANAPNRGSIPPRNSVFLFRALGDAPNITGFADTPKTTTRASNDPAPDWTVYVQCFNWVGATSRPDIQPGTRFIPPYPSPPTKYVCGYYNLSDVGGKPQDNCDDQSVKCGQIPSDQNKDIRGKICNTDTQMLPDTKATDLFGDCK